MVTELVQGAAARLAAPCIVLLVAGAASPLAGCGGATSREARALAADPRLRPYAGEAAPAGEGAAPAGKGAAPAARGGAGTAGASPGGERANASTASERAGASTAGERAGASTAGERANASTAGERAGASTAGERAGAGASPGGERGAAPALGARGALGEAAGEEGLRGPLSREALARAIVARSPALRERAHRARARAAEARAAGALPPPVAMATLWQAPLRSPYLYGEGSMLMLGLQQTFPAAGARSAEARAMLEEARAEIEALAAGERELVRRAERAFADYAEARRLERVHLEHRTLLAQLRDTARARISTGGTALLDLAKVELDAARLEGEAVMAEGGRARAAAELNALLGRPPGAPLGEPADEAPAAPRASLDEVRELARRNRPEFAEARALSRREGARAEAAAANARWPEITLGLNYGLMRQSGLPDTWGATAAVSLPWLTPASGARRDAAASSRAAAAAGERSAALDVEREVGEAYARARSAARQLALLEARVRPASDRAVEAARAAYVGGPGDALPWLDALRLRLDVTKTLVEARGELDRALADLDRAAGAPVPRGALDPGEATHGG
ncbi:MAG TPA: TolC family protein [Polyangiaceae bacterium]|nr:TolC family protein [Polyangiaceae bacterium]